VVRAADQRPFTTQEQEQLLVVLELLAHQDRVMTAAQQRLLGLAAIHLLLVAVAEPVV
jgi:hypothetical protein